MRMKIIPIITKKNEGPWEPKKKSNTKGVSIIASKTKPQTIVFLVWLGLNIFSKLLPG